MKKKLILLLGMLVLTVSLIGCGNKNDVQTSSDVPATENEPVASGEMDFTEYENGNKDISEVVDSQPGYDTMKIIVVEMDKTADTRKVVAVLSDLDSFTETKDLDYYYYIYAPKNVKEVKTIGGENYTMFVNPELDKSYFSSIKASMTLQVGVVGKDMEGGVEVVYEDNTKDAVKVFVTRE